MAFLVFGRKNSPQKQPNKLTAAPVVAPATRSATPPLAPTQGPTDAAPALDTRHVEELPSLDFTKEQHDTDASLGASTNIELQDAPSAGHPAIDEAAMLYANGHDNAAMTVLERVLDDSEKSTGTEQIWAMLFDLYQASGKREAFEKRALEYVVKFEKSPPTWVTTTAEGKAAATASLPLVTLANSLSAASTRQIEQLVRLASQHRRVRVDLGKLTDADNDGSVLLMNALQAIKRVGQEVVVLNATNLAARLERKIAEDGNTKQAAWLLLLELYQRQGMHERFEEMALEYAIKFEVSPPSWEFGTKVPAANQANQPESPKEEGFRLVGELTGGAADVFVALSQYASDHSNVVIDLSALRRMDFISAGTFLNTLSSLAAAGKAIRLYGANGLVAALLGIIGVNQIAKIERKK